MRFHLIAWAIAGALTSGAAAAAGVTTQHEATFATVQYQYGQYRSEERAATINDREARINDRIERGMRDGRITDREAHRLHRQIRDIEAKERDFRNNNGRIGPREADELNRDLDRLANDVRREMRDHERY